MATVPEMETQPMPVHIREAMEALIAVPPDDPDLELSLRTVEASAILRNVWPIYEPLPPPAERLPAARAVELAREALTRAIEGAASVEEAIRAGAAAGVLAGQRAEGFM